MIEGLEELIRGLDDPSFSRRRIIVTRLAELGDAALPALTFELEHHRESETRIAAAVDAVVASAGDVEQAIAPLASHANPALVADIAQILGRRRSHDSLTILVGLLGHASDNVAVAAIEALGRIGGRAAVAPLLAALDRREFFRVFPAIGVLGRTGDPRAVEPLAQLLDHPHYALEAARGLGHTGQPSAVRHLAKLLEHDNALYVRVGATAIGELRARCFEQYAAQDRFDADLIAAIGGHHRLAPRLIRSMVGGEAAEKAATARLLGAVGGDEALQALLALLEEPEEEAASAAAEALREMAPFPAGDLELALSQGTSRSRAVLLARIDRPELEASVREVLSDPDEQVRVAGVRSLARMGLPSVTPSIFALLSDESSLVRQAALAALFSLGGRELEAEALRGAHAAELTLRRASLRVLAHFGRPDAEETLLAALSDDDPQCRDVALAGLAVFESDRAIAAIMERAKSTDRETRASAVRAMRQLDAALVRGALSGALADEDEWVRYYACRSLGRLQDRPSLSRVMESLQDASKLVRLAAIEATAQIGGAEAVGALEKTIHTEDEDVLRAALIGLGLLGGAEASVAIAPHLTSPSSATRLVALSALEKIRTPATLEIIRQRLEDVDPRVQRAAFEALAEWPGREAAEIIRDLLLADSDQDRYIEALARPVSGRTEIVLEALNHADETTAPALTAALARSSAKPTGRAALEDALIRGTPAARKAAGAAMIASGGRDQHNAVRDAVASERDPEVRRVLNLLLGEAGMSSVDPPLYAIFSAFVEDLVGLRYDDSSRDILMDKLSVAAAEAGFASLLDYYYFLRYHEDRGPAIEELIEQLVVGETYFFRELPALRFLVAEVILPKVQAGLHPRIWCAACATGEEPLTLAMLLDEAGALSSTTIVATDISRRNLERAKRGRFRARSLRDPEPDPLIRRYLRRVRDEVTIDRRMVEHVEFSRINLLEPATFGRLGAFDAIVCRNVLIYFSEEGVRRVVLSLKERLVADGVLVVGVSESLFRLDVGMVCEERRGTFYYRKAAA